MTVGWRRLRAGGPVRLLPRKVGHGRGRGDSIWGHGDMPAMGERRVVGGSPVPESVAPPLAAGLRSSDDMACDSPFFPKCIQRR